LFVNLVKQTLKIPKPEGFQKCASFSPALVVVELIELFPTAQKLQNLSLMLQFFFTYFSALFQRWPQHNL
jgi:hypothetical protein